MSRAARALAVAAGVAFGTALIVYYIVSYLMVSPPVVAATGSKPRGAADAADGRLFWQRASP